MGNQLQCGTGKACITPPVELLPHVMALGRATFSAISDDLFVRVIALDNGERRVLIVSFDLDKAPYPEESAKLLSEVTGAAEQDILFFAIHTHTAPLTGYRPFEPIHDITQKPPEVQQATASYEALVRERMLAAVRQAVDSLRPARLGFGRGESGINVNRCGVFTMENSEGDKCVICETSVNPAGPVDHTVSVLRIETLDGRPMAFFINYPVHCVAMFQNDRGDGSSVISSDIGGNISAHMEKRYAGAVAIWSSGAAGDVNPVMATLTPYPDPVTGEPRMHRIRSLNISQLILNTMVGRHLSDILRIAEGLTCAQTEADFSSGVEWVEVPARDDVLTKAEGAVSPEPYRVRLHLVRIGDLALVGVNGELYSALGRRIQESAPLRNTVVINHEASLVMGGPGYILDDATVRACQSAHVLRLPHNGFRALPGYLEQALARGTETLFQKAK